MSPPTTVPPTSPPASILLAAPRDCPVALAQLRGEFVPPALTVEAMNGHVPYWLPGGFGLVATWKRGNGGASAIWADNKCREVAVGYSPQLASLSPGPQVGAWIVTVGTPGACFNAVLGPATCLTYGANGRDGFVQIRAMGIDRATGDRIASSIPL
jgi:hypothetical protein